MTTAEQAPERRRTRINSKIEQLPPDVRLQVDDMITDASNTYTDISDWLKAQGHDISRGAVGRYAIRVNEAARRVAESLEKTKLILDRIERNPDLDPAKAAQAIMIDGLMQRMSTADDEFYEMPLDQAGRLLASFRRVNVAEKKLTFDMRSKIDLAFEQLEVELKSLIFNDPVLSEQLREILTKAKEKMVADE